VTLALLSIVLISVAALYIAYRKWMHRTPRNRSENAADHHYTFKI